MRISIVELEFTSEDDPNTVLNVISMLKNGDTCRPVRQSDQPSRKHTSLPMVDNTYQSFKISEPMPNVLRASVTQKLVADDDHLPILVKLLMMIVISSTVWIPLMLLLG